MSTPHSKKVQVMGKFLQGLSAYDIAKKNGFDGTEEEWLLSLSEAGASVKYVDQNLTEDQKTKARENISVPSSAELEELGQAMLEYAEQVTGELGKTVKYTAQTLNEEQKARARSNIGAVSSSDVSEIAGLSVSYIEQTLNEEQKAQARTNIGAIALDDVEDELPAIVTDGDETKVMEYTLLLHLNSNETYRVHSTSDHRTLTAGTTYRVIWNGAEYSCVAESLSSYITSIGNKSITGKGDDTGEPFYMEVDSYNKYHRWCMKPIDPDTYSIRVEVMILTGIPCSDEGKFLRVVGGKWRASSIPVWGGGDF